MQDAGALGYNKRTVEVFYFTPLFMITSEVPTDIDSRVEWVKVDKDINEIGIKEPWNEMISFTYSNQRFVIYDVLLRHNEI